MRSLRLVFAYGVGRRCWRDMDPDAGKKNRDLAPEAGQVTGILPVQDKNPSLYLTT
jgi:hypothetical protein